MENIFISLEEYIPLKVFINRESINIPLINWSMF